MPAASECCSPPFNNPLVAGEKPVLNANPSQNKKSAHPGPHRAATWRYNTDGGAAPAPEEAAPAHRDNQRS